ncbi:MAG TPA: DUF3108 domain-containing protein, partial [Rhizomicrobium sp.]|nr:DUF3108 domain-containing protein [Rhizomicrobium sp.]
LDPVSAVALVTTGASANSKEPCGTIAPVFDGARRYDIVMDYVKTDQVTTDNGLYAGPAFVCQIHYKQIAGFKQKILEEGSRLPDIFAWVVSYPSRADAGRHYIVPVKVWATTAFGTIAATAENVKVDGVSIKRGKSN